MRNHHCYTADQPEETQGFKKNSIFFLYRQINSRNLKTQKTGILVHNVVIMPAAEQLLLPSTTTWGICGWFNNTQIPTIFISNCHSFHLIAVVYKLAHLLKHTTQDLLSMNMTLLVWFKKYWHTSALLKLRISLNYRYLIQFVNEEK